MRKLIVSMNITLDGFMSGAAHELDWHFQAWTAEMAEVASELLGRADTILLGRITYRAMANYWTSGVARPCIPREDIDFAEMINRRQKIVFSKTLASPFWNNSSLLRGDVNAEILRLKNLPGGNMITYGSGKLAAHLINAGLVDEYQLWIHPVLLGKGTPFFRGQDHRLSLKLIRSRTFRSGVVMLIYQSLNT